MSSQKPKTVPALNQIIVGDVGSGKTIVAFFILVTFLTDQTRTNQAALLAPTDILANQHHQNFLNFLESIQDLIKPIRVVFKSGKKLLVDNQKITPKKLAEMDQTTPTLWIGTHALLHQKSLVADLIIIDEQHRFGVKQRQTLIQQYQTSSKNSKIRPHFVSLSATPIPRTLALTAYKFLKPHFLETLPGKTSIQTEILTLEQLTTRGFEEIEQRLILKQKIYVICPKIEPGEEENDIWSVDKAYQILSQKFPNKVDYVHGKMKEKTEILKNFSQSEEGKILVSTTVVEVGVDVKQATLMIILNSERFGLAALHQIRGRIGRNKLTNNLCLALVSPEFFGLPRLNYFQKYQDGFKLAEKDLELRGSGDLLGTSQSGLEPEIQEIIGLNKNLYLGIKELVDTIDLQNLDAVDSNLPRLNNYLKTSLHEFWGE